jgi:hypothetical protein
MKRSDEPRKKRTQLILMHDEMAVSTRECWEFLVSGSQ